jgi:hypothetical protein
MKWGRFLPLVLLGFATTGAHAQAAAYFNPIVTRVSNSQVDTGTFAYLGQGNTSALRGGVAIGGYYMFTHGARTAFGIDVRDEWQRGSNSLLNSFLLGIRAQGTVGERLHPYAELLGGVGTTRAPFTAVRTSKGAFKVYGGLDYTVNKRLDFRAVEIGYGTLTTSNSSLYNTAISYPSSTLLSFSSGLVVRFGR